MPEGWTGQRFHLGKNKEVLDTEPPAIHHAMSIFVECQETGETYITFSDSTAAIERA